VPQRTSCWEDDPPDRSKEILEEMRAGHVDLAVSVPCANLDRLPGYLEDVILHVPVTREGVCICAGRISEECVRS
jgi:sulfopyruvate decarboxylase TPP-binding subunit